MFPMLRLAVLVSLVWQQEAFVSAFSPQSSEARLQGTTPNDNLHTLNLIESPKQLIVHSTLEPHQSDEKSNPQLWGDRNLVSAAAVSEVKSQHGKDVVVENLFGEGEKEDSGKNGNRFLISAAAVSEMKGGGRRELLTEEEGVRHLVSAAAVSDVKSQKGKEVILDDTEQQQDINGQDRGLIAASNVHGGGPNAGGGRMLVDSKEDKNDNEERDLISASYVNGGGPSGQGGRFLMEGDRELISAAAVHDINTSHSSNGKEVMVDGAEEEHGRGLIAASVVYGGSNTSPQPKETSGGKPLVVEEGDLGYAQESAAAVEDTKGNRRYLRGNRDLRVKRME